MTQLKNEKYLNDLQQKQSNLCNMHCNLWLDRILNQQPFHNNYFYYSYLYGEWDINCCPAYLKKQNSNNKNTLLKSYDLFLNNKYNVTLNQKTIERVRNFFQ